MFDTILFDLDGTLSESGEGIMAGFRYALEQVGFTDFDSVCLRSFVGPPPLESFGKCGLDGPRAREALEIYREYFRAQGIYNHRPYEGVGELLEALKASGKKLGLATSKPESFAVQIVGQYGFTSLFDVVAGCELDGGRSDKTEVLAYALERLGVGEREKSRTAMVGDRKFDILAAKSCAVTAVGVSYGYAEEGELETTGADFVAGSVSALRAYLLGS